MRTSWTCAGLMLLLGLIAPARGQTPDDLGHRLDRAVQAATNGGYWGVVLVERGGETLIAKGYGFANYADRPNTPETLFEIASISKPITALGVMRLVELGALTVDTPVSEVFPELVSAERSGVTVRTLLTHTSGIQGGALPYASDATRDEAVAAFFNAQQTSEPGTTFAYSNQGYAVLAAVIEKTSGDSFEAFMRREVFERAGMRDTGFINERGLDTSRAAARLSDGAIDRSAADWHWSWGYRGMGGVVTTAEDIARLDDALRAGRVVRPETLALMHEAPTATPYGLGWSLKSAWDGAGFAHHGGGVAGFGCMVRRGIEHDELIVLLSNGGTNLWQIEAAIDEVLRPEPTLTAVLLPGDYELGEYKSVTSEDASWRLEPDETGVVLTFLPSEGEPLVRIALPKSIAAGLARSLDRAIAACPGQESGKIEAGIYMYPYERVARIELTGLEMQAMPMYRGRDESGATITDERVTVIAVDEANRFWPVMVKLPKGEARKLARAIEAAAG